MPSTSPSAATPQSIPAEAARVARPPPLGEDGLFFRSPQAALYCADVRRLSSIPPQSVDLTVTSPPYNVEKAYSSYDDAGPYQSYLDFTREWLARALELSRPTGRLCLNVPLDKNRPSAQPVYADVARIARDVGWRYHSTIIWNEQNISRRTAWGSWRSASAPFVIAPVEAILVLYRDAWKRADPPGPSSIERDEFIEWTNGVWTFPGESARRVGHPAPFPLELPTRCVKLFSFEGDVVLDPFAGSGSTLLACRPLKRFAIGVEVDREYCRLAVGRLEGASPPKPSHRPSRRETASPPAK